jgi:hypothetical protein
MSEEKKEKKKPGIIKQIFKWIGLGILILLLAVAVFFQASWKITTLLLVILLACTVLPKPMRKWFWAGVGVLAIVFVIWVFLPDNSGDWKPYTFNEELAKLEASRAIPDEENAALIYNILLKNYDRDYFEPNLSDPNIYRSAQREFWTDEEYPELAEWLQSRQSTIETLTEACNKDLCRFPLKPDIMILDSHLDILSSMRYWTYLLICAGNNDIAEGRVDKALEKYTMGLQIAKHLHQQPRTVDLLVGIAMETLAIKRIRQFIVTGSATEQNLNFIESAFDEIEHDWSSDLSQILNYEKLVLKNLYGKMFYEINAKGRIRVNQNQAAFMNKQMQRIGIKQKLNYWQIKVFKAMSALWWFYIPSTPQKVSKIIDERFEIYREDIKADFEQQKELLEFSAVTIRLNFRYLIDVMCKIMQPVYYKIHDKYTHIDKRGSQLLVGLRRYKNHAGKWPSSLDEIKDLAPSEAFVDPINDMAFVYKLTEDGFRLYSKGKNNIDEQGEYKNDGPDDWSIWPTDTKNFNDVKENSNVE